MSFAEYLLRARRERGWSRNEAGRYLGVTGTQVRRYEEEGAQPTLPVAARLARRIGVSLDEIAGITPPGGVDPGVVRHLREVAAAVDALEEAVRRADPGADAEPG